MGEGNPDVSQLSVEEIRKRMEKVLRDLDEAFKRVGPVVEEIAELRIEAHVMYKELLRRGVVKEPQGGQPVTR